MTGMRPPSSGKQRHRSRDRHGRGIRGRLIPASSPASRTSTQVFDELVLAAAEHVENGTSRSVGDLEFAVEEVPGTLSAYDKDVLEDGQVPLAHLLDGRGGGRGVVRPRIILYRRPLEARAGDPAHLADLINAVVIEQVASYLGVHPDDLE